jgi:hypothetical protein
MNHMIANLTSFAFIGLGLWHFYMAFTGQAKDSPAVPTHEGIPLFVPSVAMTVFVGIVLLLFAVLVAATSSTIAVGLPMGLLASLSYGLSIGLFARAVGDFNYIGFFKRVRGSKFARMDTFLYSPLCLVLSAGVALVAFNAS